MKKLDFSSLLLKETSRYSAEFALPDYFYNSDGSLDRAAMINTILKEEYGVVDVEGVETRCNFIKETPNVCAGKGTNKRYEVVFLKNGKKACIPIEIYIPKIVNPFATVMQVNFENTIPNNYCPIEELMDFGVVIIHICYLDISSDDGDFNSGIASFLVDRKKQFAAGKIAVWSYALRVIGKHLKNCGEVIGKLYVAGHSRLGKTALLTAALDNCFDGAFVNNSGCCGAAISREKTGETIKDITKVFPFWFTPNFIKYVDNENEMPFDQHWLLALVAPRKLFISVAELDTWADTDAQYLAAEAASVVYEKMGKIGLKRENGLITYGQMDNGGEICFFKRHGSHCFSREDWGFYLKTLKTIFKI